MNVIPVPEVREMVETAKGFIRGESTIQDLYAHSSKCATIIRRINGHPEILALANRWSQLADMTWDEWGLNHAPMSRNELCIELEKDLDGV